MSDTAFAWMEKEAIRLAYAKIGNKANEELMVLRVARSNRLIDEPCIVAKKRWFRKNVLRCMTLAEAQEAWKNRTENDYYDKEFVNMSMFDTMPYGSERRHWERTIKNCEDKIATLKAIKKEKVLMSFEDINRLKEYL